MMPPSSGTEGSSSPRRLSPFVFWAQTEKGLSFRVGLQRVSEPSINVCAEKLEFAASGVGANKGRNEYYFKFTFFRNINPETVKVQMKGPEVVITVEKAEADWWPRLTLDTFKPAWLKLDFDKLRTGDDDELGDDEHSAENLYSRLLDEDSRNRHHRSTAHPGHVEEFRKLYLLMYNLTQFFGFLYILIVLTLQYSREGTESIGKAYNAVKTAINFCQLLQILEFLHPLLGYTSGSVLLPFLQVTGRLVVVFGMINFEPRIQTKPAVFYLFFAYAVVEVIRYPYYILRIYNTNVSLITWLRYTVWIPMYPLGFLCEGIIILRNIPYFEETKKFSLFLPNQFNFSFYFPTIMRLYLLLGLFPLMYFMMTHMYRQRAKVLDRDRHMKRD